MKSFYMEKTTDDYSTVLLQWLKEFFYGTLFYLKKIFGGIAVHIKCLNFPPFEII